MSLLRVLAAIAFVAILGGYYSLASAGTHRSSPFSEARHSASELDLILQHAQETWWRVVVREPSDEFTAENRLMVIAGLVARFYYYGEDSIEITGWITDLDGFLRLSVAERKQLTRDILSFAHALLDQKVSVFEEDDEHLPTGRIENSHFDINVAIGSYLLDDQDRPLRGVCFPQISTGQAAYRNGSFYFSKPYYLELSVVDGIAESGDAAEFVIEVE